MAEISEKTTLSGRAVARVDVGAIAFNVTRLRDELSGGAELCAVVKADGYGHGIRESAKAAVAGGATRLAVVTSDEAAILAELQLGVPIIILAPVTAEDLAGAIETGAELSVSEAVQVFEIATAAAELGRTVGIHVKLDTGMGRYGAKTLQDALVTLEAVRAQSSLVVTGVWTHFATADEPGDEYFGEQLAKFSEFAEQAKARFPNVLAHAANSAAVLRDPASHFDFVRCGIAIYGLDPFHRDAAANGLRPALSLHSYVAAIREMSIGESATYGRRFVADADTLLATIPIGYGDGWRRALTNNADVLIGGRRYPQRGTVSMDSITVDLGADSAVEIGADVTLIGSDGDEFISTEEVAQRAGTINYEITCGLTPRTVRSYYSQT